VDVVTAEASPEQREIIDLSPDTRLLVSADPGTGKTFTLMERASSVAEKIETTVLALSFTRAVVAEIRTRTATRGGMPLTASTIDSYAGQLVRSAGIELAATFDGVIGQAMAIMTDTPHRAARPGHVLVDEVQDLAGTRLAFVRTLLHQSEGGFSLFGDPRQAIYGWDSKDEPLDVFDVIRREFTGLVEASLMTIHRGYVAERLTGPYRTARGVDLIRDAAVMTSVRQAALAMKHGDCVLLTRTNGEALAMSKSLADDGYTAVVRQGAEERMAPPWLTLFAAIDVRPRWTRKQLLNMQPESDELPEPDVIWRTLRRIAGDGPDVSLQRLRIAVNQPWLYDEFSPTDGQLSTIHRAKGLEWDTVIVLDRPMGELSAEDERVLFVAATRARLGLWRLAAPRFEGQLKVAPRDGRWEMRSWGKHYTIAFETKIGDVSASEPFGGRSAFDAQQLLRTCRPGDDVRLEPSEQGYTVLRAGDSIGRMTDGFTDAVDRRWQRNHNTLVGARIFAVRSAAGDESVTERADLGSTGLWLVPEIFGLVRPEGAVDV
jgi:DNA helicase-2/ATP-dependent DNA helicase PcrA